MKEDLNKLKELIPDENKQFEEIERLKEENNKLIEELNELRKLLKLEEEKKPIGISKEEIKIESIESKKEDEKPKESEEINIVPEKEDKPESQGGIKLKSKHRRIIEKKVEEASKPKEEKDETIKAADVIVSFISLFLESGIPGHEDEFK